MDGGALRSIRSLPGPWRLPLLGNALQIRRTRVHQDIERWCRQYGKFFRVDFGPTPVLVVADHTAVAGILRDRPDGFRRPSVTAAVSREMGGIPGVFMSEGEAWRAQRRMVMPAFAPHVIKTYFPHLVKVALRLQRRWDAAAAAGTPIDLAEDLKRYTVDIIAGLAFGTDVNTIESGEDVIQRHLDRILPEVARRSLSLIPYWRWFKLPRDRRLDASVAAMRSAVQGFIAQARERMRIDRLRREHPPNLLEAMIGAADQEQGILSDQDVAGNVTTMLLAGEDTTANTISWLLYLLQRHPQAMLRARDEVRQQLPEGEALSVEHLNTLHYLDACAQEAMRLKPVAPFIPLEALRETVVGGIRVPAGAFVWCVMRHDSVDEAYFERAAAFEPERWLDAGAPDKQLAQPFGGGPRTCPGRYLALLEIKLLMAMLLRRYDVAYVATLDGAEARELMGFVMSPDGLSMGLRRSAPQPAGL